VRVEALAAAVNARITGLSHSAAPKLNASRRRILSLERQAGRLVRFVAEGGESRRQCGRSCRPPRLRSPAYVSR
jgi:hypothetical protein